jgi:LacI family transcriptional regulator
VKKERYRTIAVLVDFLAGPAASMHRGIARFARTEANWKLVRTARSEVSSVRLYTKGEVDGLIISDASIDGHIIDDALASGIPAVNLVQRANGKGVPMVCADNLAIGKIAAEHLLGLGYRRLGYVYANEAPDHPFRRDGFLRTASQAGIRSAAGNFPFLWIYEPTAESQQQFIEWIRALGTPCGLLAFCDQLGDALIATIKRCGLRVPDDVAVVGVDDNEMLCEYSDPPLSSVDPNDAIIGYRAAQFLERMLDGKQPVAAQTLIPPIGVIERASTQALAVDDEDVARVLRLMRERMSEHLTIDEMAQHVSLSKRTLQVRFKKCLDCEPFEELMRIRIEYAKKRLAEPGVSIAAIAIDSGFGGSDHFCRAFQKRTGLTPSLYRQACRG